MYFHDVKNKVSFEALKTALKNFLYYPQISLLRKPWIIYWENLYAFHVAKIVEKHAVDLIHAHFAYPEGFVGVLAKRAIRKPLIVTLHGRDILTEPSVGYGIRLSRRYDALIRKTLEEADSIVVASSAVYDEARKIIGSEDKIHLIPNGVDIQEFNPNLDGSRIRGKLKVDEEYTVIFTLRHHEPTYGIEYLIRAIPLVLRREKNVMFVIGGEGSLKRYHERLALKLGVKDRVVFTGRIPRTEAPYYYAMSDVVVVPSLQEAFGLVVTEAMACGKPVIGTDVGGISDQIIDGFNGFLVPSKNPEAIAERIIWLINNPGKAKCMGRNGRRIVEEKFNIEKRIDKIINLYDNILG